MEASPFPHLVVLGLLIQAGLATMGLHQMMKILQIFLPECII